MSKESIRNDRVVNLIRNEVKTKGVRGLAREIGISPAIITRYMSGKVGEPTQATLEKLSKYFGVTVAELRGDSMTSLFSHAMSVLVGRTYIPPHIEAAKLDAKAKESKQQLELDKIRYRDLIQEFMRIPLEEMDIAISVLYDIFINKIERINHTNTKIDGLTIQNINQDAKKPDPK